MLSVAALSTAATAAPTVTDLNTIFSPSKHPFMKRMVAVPNRFSFDPYKSARMQMSAAPTANTVTLPPVMSAAPAPSSIQYVAAPIITMAPAASILPAPANRSFAAPSALSYRVVMVSFKHSSAPFKAPFKVTEGDKVIVEGDRGEHIGSISAILPCNTAITSSSKIIRRATAADLEAAEAKLEKEMAVLSEVSKIAKEVRLNALVADVEFQLDLNKLTIFVERATSSTFVDFRKVQRTLFKMFHCRIWFVYMDEVSNLKQQMDQSVHI